MQTALLHRRLAVPGDVELTENALDTFVRAAQANDQDAVLALWKAHRRLVQLQLFDAEEPGRTRVVNRLCAEIDLMRMTELAGPGGDLRRMPAIVLRAGVLILQSRMYSPEFDGYFEKRELPRKAILALGQKLLKTLEEQRIRQRTGQNVDTPKDRRQVVKMILVAFGIPSARMDAFFKYQTKKKNESQPRTQDSGA